MNNQAFIVRAECVDVRSGKRCAIGEEFSPPPSPDQASRLVAALCLPVEAIDAAKSVVADLAALSRDQLNNDGLFDMTVADLKAVAHKEALDLGSASRKEDIVAAIRAGRVAK